MTTLNNDLANGMTNEANITRRYINPESNRVSPRNLTNVNSSNKKIKVNKCINSQGVNIEAEKKNAITWHRRLGHINYRKLGVAHKTVEGIGKVLAPNIVYEVCAEAKATRKPYKQTNSRYATTYVLKNKKETADRLEAYFKYLRTLFPQPGRLAALRTDAGTEFTNAKVRKMLKEMGIRLELAETDIHEHNGTAERFNRTHQNKIRALLFDAGFPNTFWGWASDAATYLYNRVPHTANGDITPFEKFFGKQPNIKNIRVFGTLAHTLLPRAKRLNKRTGKRYIIGFTDTGYLVYNPANGKTERTCNIRTDKLRNYGDDLGNRKDRSATEIDFMAGDTSGNSTYSEQSENNSKMVSGNGINKVNNEMMGGKDNRKMGATTNTIGDDTGFETINESITLESCISLDNSEPEETAKENYRVEANIVPGQPAAGKDAVGKEQAVTIRNEDSDSDAEDDDNASIYSIELDSNITLGDKMGKSAVITEWDTSKMRG